MVIIGLTGLPQSGKRSVASILTENFNFNYINLEENNSLHDSNIVSGINLEENNSLHDSNTVSGVNTEHYTTTSRTCLEDDDHLKRNFNDNQKEKGGNNEAKDFNRKLTDLQLITSLCDSCTSSQLLSSIHSSSSLTADHKDSCFSFAYSVKSTNSADSSRLEDFATSKNNSNFAYISFPNLLHSSSASHTSCQLPSISSSSLSPSILSFSQISASSSFFKQNFATQKTFTESSCNICNTKNCPNSNKDVFDHIQNVKTKSAQNILKQIMKNWRKNYVVTPITHMCQVNIFRHRPFFLLIFVDSSSFARLKRKQNSLKKFHNDANERYYDLENFLRNNDKLLYGCFGEINRCMSRCDFTLKNEGTLEELGRKISELRITNEELWRPSWDIYFMRLAYLASTRSNCMKRRVGALVVREKRVISTGYNGTPSGVLDCNKGGCNRCNNYLISQGQELEACECIHAEVNALLEAGRDRCMRGTMYVTCTPCLGCAKLIIQSGIKCVFYGRDYDNHGSAIILLKKSAVVVKKLMDEHPFASYESLPVLD